MRNYADNSGTGAKATLAHVAPFAVWVVLMWLMGEPAAWKYAVRSAAGLGMLLVYRPWRWYGKLQLTHLPLALGVGLFVFAIWVLPEHDRFAGLRPAYLTWGVLPFGGLPAVSEASPYAPETCGWMMAVVRLLGSGLVIAAIEEFFWRGFFYRWMLGRRFTEVPLVRFQAPIFVVVCLAFGFEHHRWLAGAIAGAAYGLLVIRTRDLWAAVVAHQTTNLALGAYVLATGAYAFW